jgi:cobalt-zinc-cadmium efflux system membrane fusion protein
MVVGSTGLSRSTQLTVVASFAAIVLAGVGLLPLIDGAAGKSEQQDPAGRGQTVPGTFTPTKEQWDGLKFAAAETKLFRPERTTEGNIAIDDDLNTQVFSPYSGRVTRLIAQLGDTVKEGAPLMVVEATEFVQAQNDLITALSTWKTAQSQLRLTQTAEKRNHDLYLANGGSLKDWQQSQADLVAAQNALRAAEIGLAAVRNRLRILGRSETEIGAIESAPSQRMDPTAYVLAPIAGTVIQRQVGLGQNIQSVSSGANPVYTIGDLSTVWLIANVRETDAGAMQLGDPVEVRVPAYPGRVFKAKISWVSPSIDANTHRLPVRADVENPGGALKPMMFAGFTIVTGEAAAAAAVPAEAIVYEGEEAHVWVVGDGDTLALREIRPGRISDGMVEIVSGLAAGDKVVTSGSVFIDRASKAD